jgi:purine-binding chemotaxis protein CheW
VTAHGAGDTLTFSVTGESLALASASIAEIIRPPALTRVPHGPPSLLGVANVRGNVLPVLSLARLLDREPGVQTPATRVVVVSRGTVFGLLIDAVSGLGDASDGRLIDLDVLLARDFSTALRRSGGQARSVAPACDAQPDAGRGADSVTLIGFHVAGQDYALPLDRVAEVTILPAAITAAPGADRAMLGMTAIRGQVLPLVSLRVLLGLPADGFDHGKARVVFVRLGNALLGLVVDGMKAILRVDATAIDTVPAILTRGRGEAQIDAICRIESADKLVPILSPARLFDNETAARMLASAGGATTDMAISEQKIGATEQFVIFRLSGEYYGVPIAAVSEIVRYPAALSRVPRAPDFIDGVMNLRGRVVPVINQARRFSLKDDPDQRARRVIVVTFDRARGQSLQAGFAVDGVSEILAVAASELSAAPEMVADGAPLFDRVATIRRDGRMILVVDPQALLEMAERDVLHALVTDAEAGQA